MLRVDDYLRLQRVSTEQINKYPIAIACVIKNKFEKKNKERKIDNKMRVTNIHVAVTFTCIKVRVMASLLFFIFNYNI